MYKYDKPVGGPKRKFSFKVQKAMILRRREKRRHSTPNIHHPHMLHRANRDAYLSGVLEKWRKERDPEARRQYLAIIGAWGGKRVRGEVKKKSGQLGGLQTKLVKRKAYVNGEKHGNFGKRRRNEQEPVQLPEFSRDEYLALLKGEAERRLKNPGAFGSLTWKPFTIEDISFVKPRRNLLQSRMSRRRKTKDSR